MKKYHYTLFFLIGLFCSLGMSAQKVGDTFTYNSDTYEIKSVTPGNRTVRLKKVGMIYPNTMILNEVTYNQEVYKVTEIARGVFENKKTVNTVVLGENIELIDDNAFHGCTLKTIDLKNTVTIKMKAFNGCTNLRNIQSNALKTIELYAFMGCENLESIDFPHIEEIGQQAFDKCTALATINLSEAPNLNFKTFNGTQWLNNQPNGMVYLKKSLYLYKGTMPRNSSIEVKDDTKKIAGWAFQNQTNMVAINIKNVERLDARPFQGCTGLKSITTWATTPPVVIDNFASNLANNKGQFPFDVYVPIGTSKKYENDEQWKKCKSRNEFDAPVQKIVCNLTDGQDFVNATPTYYDEIHYTRNFKNNKWQPLFVPYSMKYEDWAENFEVARLNNVHQYDKNEDGDIDLTAVEIIKLNQGMTKPNKPYLIRANNPGIYKFITTNTTLEATKATCIECSSFTSTFAFTGTYERYSGTGHYVMVGGDLRPAASSSTGPGAFRWYLIITPRNGFTQYAPKQIFFVEGEDEMTGLEEITPSASTYNIFNLNGQLVRKGAKTTQGLPKGIYIINGKKVIL